MNLLETVQKSTQSTKEIESVLRELFNLPPDSSIKFMDRTTEFWKLDGQDLDFYMNVGNRTPVESLSLQRIVFLEKELAIARTQVGVFLFLNMDNSLVTPSQEPVVKYADTPQDRVKKYIRDRNEFLRSYNVFVGPSTELIPIVDRTDHKWIIVNETINPRLELISGENAGESYEINGTWSDLREETNLYGVITSSETAAFVVVENALKNKTKSTPLTRGEASKKKVTKKAVKSKKAVKPSWLRHI